MSDLRYNRMQAQFLSPEFLQLVSMKYGRVVHDHNKREIYQRNLEQIITTEVDFEAKQHSVLFGIKTFGAYSRDNMKRWVTNLQASGKPMCSSYIYNDECIGQAQLEVYIDRLGNNEPFPAIWTGTSIDYCVTIITRFGNNYPDILRNIKSRSLPGHNPILFYIEYDGDIMFNVVEQIFTNAGVKLLLCADKDGK